MCMIEFFLSTPLDYICCSNISMNSIMFGINWGQVWISPTLVSWIVILQLSWILWHEHAGPGNQLQWTLILDCLELHSKTVFFTNFWGLVCAYKLIFELAIFCWVDKMLWFRSAMWVVLPEPGAGSQQLFLQMLLGSLFPQFLRRVPGNKANSQLAWAWMTTVMKDSEEGEPRSMHMYIK